MNEKSTLALTGVQLARLLALAAGKGDEGPSEPPTAEGKLRALLRQSVAGEPGARTVADVLLGRETDLAALRALKDRAKTLVRAAAAEADDAAATTVYYAAIARALVDHGERLSRHSAEKLAEAFSKLERMSWMPPDLIALFAKARTRCRASH